MEQRKSLLKLFSSTPEESFFFQRSRKLAIFQESPRISPERTQEN